MEMNDDFYYDFVKKKGRKNSIQFTAAGTVNLQRLSRLQAEGDGPRASLANENVGTRSHLTAGDVPSPIVEPYHVVMFFMLYHRRRT